MINFKNSIKLFMLTLISATISISSQNINTKNANENWILTFEDNFDSNKLDTNKWNIQTGNGFFDGDTYVEGWGNRELEYYTNRDSNLKIENGILKIIALKEKYEGVAGNSKKIFDYTSAKIDTKGNFSQKYGKFEMRAKLPTGKGLWPAFWLLPQDNNYGIWAASGEIDIMEGWGSKQDRVAGTLHFGSTAPNNTHKGAEHILKSGSTNEFHTYSIEWEPGEIRWYIDGVLYQTQNNWYSRDLSKADFFNEPAPFDKPFYVILNLAVGGWFDGNPESNANYFPQSYEIDYVRVYKKNEYKKIDKTIKNDSKSNTSFNVNLIKNHDFKQKLSNWTFLEGFGGKASATLENFENNNFLKVNILESGQFNYSTQLIQTLKLEENNWYKLTFDAKSDSNREISLKVGGDEARKWVAYFQNKFLLDDKLNTYSVIFKMKDPSDEKARVEFNLGLSKSPIWISNIKLERIENIEESRINMPKAHLISNEQIYNGEFNVGQSPLSYWKYSNGVNSNDNGISFKGISSIEQNGLQLHKGKYTLKLNGNGSFKVKINNIIETINVKNNNISKQIEIDNSNLNSNITITSSNDSKLSSISLKRNIDLSTVNSSVLDDSFNNNTRGWKIWTGSSFGESGVGSILSSGNSLTLNISDKGDKEWSVHIFKDLKLMLGAKYKVTIIAKSSSPRNINLVVENSSYQRSLSKNIELNNEYNEYTFEFSSSRNEDAAIKLLAGNTDKSSKSNKIDIQKIKIEIIN